MRLRKRISKDEIHEMGKVDFPGSIFVVDTLDKVDKAVHDLLQQKVIGFDTETRPSFKKGKRYEMSLLQLSTENRAYLFRFNKIGFHPAVLALLENENILKIGLSIKDDFMGFQRFYKQFKPKSFVELQTYVKKFNIEDNSLQKIYANVFGERISKSQRLSNWEVNAFSEAQMNYAAIDAWACLRLWNDLEIRRKRREKYKERKLRLSVTAD